MDPSLQRRVSPATAIIPCGRNNVGIHARICWTNAFHFLCKWKISRSFIAALSPSCTRAGLLLTQSEGKSTSAPIKVNMEGNWLKISFVDDAVMSMSSQWKLSEERHAITIIMQGSKCLAITLPGIEIRNDGQKRCKGKNPIRPTKERMHQQANELVLGGVEDQHDMGVDSRCATSGDERLSPERRQQGSWDVKPLGVTLRVDLWDWRLQMARRSGTISTRSVPLVMDGTDDWAPRLVHLKWVETLQTF